MKKAVKRPHRLAFLRKWWQLIIMMLAFTSAVAQDQSRYSPINGYGFKYKRHVVDSVMLVPLFESPHIPYRGGAIKWRQSDSSFYKYTGTQWLKVQEGSSGGIDTVYTQDDTVQVIVTPDETYYTLINRQPYTEVVDDSTIIIGGDTLIIHGIGGTGILNQPVGTGYSILKPGTQEIKRLADGYGVLTDSTTTANTLTRKADSFALATKPWVNKVADSLSSLKLNKSDTAAMLANYIVGSGYGIIKSGKFLRTDTFNIASRDYAKKLADSAISKSHAELLDSLNKTTQVMNPIYVRPGANASIPDTISLLHDGTLDTTSAGELTISPAVIPSVNPGVYFSPAQFANPAFMVMGSAIVRPTNSFSHGADILWDIINYTSDHNSSFFDSVYGHTADGRLYVRYPNVKYVFNGMVSPDEVFSQQCVVAGPSVGLTILQLNAYRPYTVGFRLTGNGAGTWTVTGATPSLITASTYNTTTGVTGFNLTAPWGVDYSSLDIHYSGPNSYHVTRQGAFSIYNVGFLLLDEFNNPVTIDPSTSDEIIITNAGTNSVQVSLATWLNGNNSFMNTASNYFVTLLAELWMVASATSTTAIQVRWQTNYPSATTYKIYRSATGLYGTYTLIHTGTSGTFSDTGLTPGTVYTYKMRAVVGGVDTDVTTFNAATKL